MAVISYQVEEDDRPSPKSNLVRANFSQPSVEEETKGFIEADPGVYALLNHLIGKHQSDIGHLANANIKILMAKKPRKSKGKSILGTAQMFSERDRHLHSYHFLITLDLAFWDDNAHLHEALLFHELCHCQVNEKDEWCIVNHDLEEFTAVVRHYGAWLDDVRAFDRQLDMFKQQEESNA